MRSFYITFKSPIVGVTINRQGFTLVELLVVIGIITVVLAFTLPAIQEARESARRVNCANHLRQIGIALNHYHSVMNAYPVGCVEWRGPNPENRQLAWSAFLLPYIEQHGLFDNLNLQLPFDDPANAMAAKRSVQLYRCPSGKRRQGPGDRALIDYGGIFGERIVSPNNPPKGVMLIDQSVRNSEIVDGLSNTLIVAEDSKSTDGEWINGNNIFDQAFAINSGPDFENDIRSDHRLGANACLCDGSVMFLSNSTDLKLLASFCTKAEFEIHD